jgi:hypothetical protein
MGEWKMIKRLLLSVTVILVVLVGIWVESPSASISVNFSEYVPLNVGNNWVFENEFSDVFVQSIFGTELVGTEMTYQFVNFFGGGGPAYFNVKYEGNNFKFVGVEGSEVAGLTPIVFDGIDFEFTDTEDRPNRMEFYVSAPVVTPAGSFSDVIENQWYIDHGEGFALTGILYYAVGVGMIVTDDYLSIPGGIYQSRYELQSFNVVPIPSALWLLGSGLIGIVGFSRKYKK